MFKGIASGEVALRSCVPGGQSVLAPSFPPSFNAITNAFSTWSLSVGTPRHGCFSQSQGGQRIQRSLLTQRVKVFHKHPESSPKHAPLPVVPVLSRTAVPVLFCAGKTTVLKLSPGFTSTICYRWTPDICASDKGVCEVKRLKIYTITYVRAYMVIA